MLAINSSELATPAILNPPDQAEANLSASNPLASFAQKSLDESVGIGFFVSAEGHILADSLVVRDCPDSMSSTGAIIASMPREAAAALNGFR
jgi:hypothetical protein